MVVVVVVVVVVELPVPSLATAMVLNTGLLKTKERENPQTIHFLRKGLAGLADFHLQTKRTTKLGLLIFHPN